MKHNLKNRPSHDWMTDNLDHIEVVEQWFRGFEKELQQLQMEHGSDTVIRIDVILGENQP